MKPCLSGNTLKLLACLFMLSDHIGVILFPRLLILRYIGRLAFPIFAFLIAEGARYTKNRAVYLLRLLGFGLACQAVVHVFVGSWLDMNIFLTFSLSVALIYLLSFCARLFGSAAFPPLWRRTISVLLALAGLVGVGLVTYVETFDYGFFGALTPVIISLPVLARREERPSFVAERLFMLILALIILSLDLGTYEYLCVFSVPLLALYSGKRGRYRLKYFFYAFYPIHLAALYGMDMLLS